MAEIEMEVLHIGGIMDGERRKYPAPPRQYIRCAKPSILGFPCHGDSMRAHMERRKLALDEDVYRLEMLRTISDDGKQHRDTYVYFLEGINRLSLMEILIAGYTPVKQHEYEHDDPQSHQIEL